MRSIEVTMTKPASETFNTYVKRIHDAKKTNTTMPKNVQYELSELLIAFGKDVVRFARQNTSKKTVNDVDIDEAMRDRRPDLYESYVELCASEPKMTFPQKRVKTLCGDGKRTAAIAYKNLTIALETVCRDYVDNLIELTQDDDKKRINISYLQELSGDKSESETDVDVVSTTDVVETKIVETERSQSPDMWESSDEGDVAWAVSTDEGIHYYKRRESCILRCLVEYKNYLNSMDLELTGRPMKKYEYLCNVDITTGNKSKLLSRYTTFSNKHISDAKTFSCVKITLK